MQTNSLFVSKLEIALALLLFLSFCIVFIPAPDHYIRIHDNFDGNFTTRHVLIKSGKFFETDPSVIVPGIMNGLPRGVFPKFTEILSLLMYCFGSLTGFAINFILVRLVALTGILLFSRDHLMVKEDQKGLIWLLAVVFACLPFSTMHGITVSGIPLLLWAFYNFHKRVNMNWSVLIFLVFPLWSNFVLVGVHIILCLGALALFHSIKEKQVRWGLFFSVCILAVVYIASEYMLFYMHWFNKSYESSRTAFEKMLGLNLNGVMGNSFNLFFKGDYSSSNYFGFLLIPAFVILVIRFYKARNATISKGILFLSLTVIFSLFISILDWKSFDFFYQKFPIAREFNFKRFTNLLPGFFFLAGVSGFSCLNRKLMRYSATVLAIAFFVFVWRGNISFNNSTFDTSGVRIEDGQKSTFRQFFDPQLYTEIKKEIGSDTVNNVVHLGLSPSPSKYAGLNVLDDYQGDYSSEYKFQFRKVIEGELNKSSALQNYFDNWGLRCYLYSAALFEGKGEYINGMATEKKLDINTLQLKKMNTGYLLSSEAILNEKELNLQLMKVIVSSIDFKSVFLYKLI